MPDVLQPVAEALLHPPLILCRPSLQPEILTGLGNLPRFVQPFNAVSYGAIFSVQAVPAQLGRTSQAIPVYDLPLITLWFDERLQSGGTVISARLELHQLDELVRWFSFPLARVQYETLPGVSFAWSYLYLA